MIFKKKIYFFTGVLFTIVLNAATPTDDRLLVIPEEIVSVERMQGVTTDNYLNPRFNGKNALKIFRSFNRTNNYVEYKHTYDSTTTYVIKDYILPLGPKTKSTLLGIINLPINDFDLPKITKIFRRNSMYDADFFKKIESRILASPSNFQIESIVSIFYDMAYLGHTPSEEFSNTLCNCADELFNHAHNLVNTDNDYLLLHNIKDDQHSRASTVQTGKSIKKTPFDLLSILAVGSSSLAKMIKSPLYKKAFYYSIECLIYFQYYLPDATPNKYFLFSNSFLKQQMYWALILYSNFYPKNDLAPRSIEFLKTFFLGSRFNQDVGFLTSGTENNMRKSIISMKKDHDLQFFASGVNSIDFKTQIDFICLNSNNEIIFFECDGPVHFIQSLIANNPPRLNGQTFLKTALLSQFGTVVRVSSLCNERTYFARIQNLSSIFLSKDGRFSLVDEENYGGFPVDFLNKIELNKNKRASFMADIKQSVIEQAKELSEKQIQKSREHNLAKKASEFNR